MKITFILSSLGYHQIPICNELYSSLKDNFKVIATQKITSGRFGLNYDDMAKAFPYVLKAYKDKYNSKEAIEIINNSDIIVIGSSPKVYTDILNENKNIIVIRYCERFFKKGTWRRFIPKTFYSIYNPFLRNKNRQNFCTFCSSAFTSYDLSIVGGKKIKTFKWGYFPELKEYNKNELFNLKHNNTTKLLWSGRFLKWKHCEDAINACKMLKDNNYLFTLDIIGSGTEEHNLKNLVKKHKLENEIKFISAVNTDTLREYMEKANIYLFTSDKGEGWGAVLNEAMNSGCTCIASHEIGAVPFLISDGTNGFIYKSRDVNDLYNRIKVLINNNELQIKIGKEAYNTIYTLWNHKIAAQRLISFSKEFSNTNNCNLFEDGPLSKANIIKDTWFKSNI